MQLAKPGRCEQHIIQCLSVPSGPETKCGIIAVVWPLTVRRTHGKENYVRWKFCSYESNSNGWGFYSGSGYHAGGLVVRSSPTEIVKRLADLK